MAQSRGGGARGAGFIRSPHDLAGGLFLLGLAAVGFIGGFNLPFGQLSGIGSGLMPKVVAALVAAFGLLLVAQGLVLDGDRLERWHLRGPVFVLGAVLMFAATIRGATLSFAGLVLTIPPLGLVVAGPLAVIFSSLADRAHAPHRDRALRRGDHGGVDRSVQVPAAPADPRVSAGLGPL